MIWPLLAAIGLSTAPAHAAGASPKEVAILNVGMPEGFGDLARSQQSVVDILFGGRRVGQAEVSYEPGQVNFVNVDSVVAMLPDLLDPAAVRNALASGPLDAHASMICTDGADKKICGRLDPAVAEVIFDQDHFRLEIFVNARFLKVRAVTDQAYLPRPDAPLSLVDSIAGTIAGGSGGDTIFAIQNRAVLGDRDARLISTTSYASGNGLIADVLAAQVDKPGMRYTAGMFWTPGIDLVGRRKVIGAGVETQFDTRFDKDLINGSPLIVALSQRSRVDLLVDGRLVGSRTYEAGNQSIDTSGLSDGAYEVVLHIQEIGGANRDERRFFTKNPRIAPLGKPIWFFHAGVLADEQSGAFISPTRQAYVAGGMARRLSPHFAVDGTVVATDGKGIAEIGGYLILPAAQFRLGLLGSTKSDMGVLFQMNSSGTSALNYNVDVRRIYSHDDRPLIPVGDMDKRTVASISGGFQGAQLAAGTFTQAIADISYRLPRAQIGLSAFYRKDKLQKANYAIGPTARWSVYQKHGLDITVEANMSKSSNGHSAFVGVRLQLLRPRSSFSATSGAQTISTPKEGKRSSIVGGVQGAWQNEDVLGGSLIVAGNLDHTPDSDLAHARADMRGPLGVVAADVLQRLSGRGGTQYSLGIQTSAIVNRNMLSIGGREQSDSMIAVRVKDAPADSRFEVLVDETPRGIVRAGETLPVAVTPYRQYGVRIRPVSGDIVHFDNASRRVSVYPGNVAGLAWNVKKVVAMFGRAVWPDGSPIIDADIVADDAIGHTDQQGYFQIETSPDATLTVRAPNGKSCHLLLTGFEKVNGYSALGTVGCREAKLFGQPQRIAAN
jgi:hypothetical protein